MIVETQVEFASQGALLRGILLTPSASGPRGATVVMAHGTSASIRMVAIEYARSFCRAGLAVLIYDHRNFGRSEGEPRHEINPWIQCRGYVDALDFAVTRPEVDPSRLAIWGDSYTGGQVIVVSACDSRPRAVVAQAPTFGPKAPTVDPTVELLTAIRDTLLEGDVRGTPETTTGPLPVVSADQASTPSLLAPIQAFRWFIDYGGRPGSGWANQVTRVIPPTAAPYSPFLCAPFINAPVLLMVAPEDEMVHANPEVSRRAFELMPQPKRWYDIADGHFGLLYYPGERFNEAVKVQTDFLREQLDVEVL